MVGEGKLRVQRLHPVQPDVGRENEAVDDVKLGIRAVRVIGLVQQPAAGNGQVAGELPALGEDVVFQYPRGPQGRVLDGKGVQRTGEGLVEVAPGDDVIEFTKGADNDNFNLEGVNTVKQGDDSFGEVVVNINAEKGVKNLFVTIKPGDEGFSAALADLGLLDTFDLANPGDLEASLGPDGLDLPIKDAVAGKTVVPFDISGFIPMLSAFVGEHSFELRTVDSDNNEKSMILVFKVVE